jgi:UDP-glucose 4-epimerase
MKKKGILLLGGGGFLGCALARQLVDDNKRVHIMTPNKHPAIASNAITHQASLDDEKILKSILPECGTIIHLASSTNPGNSARHPALEAKLNIAPSLNFLEILQNHKPFHLIYISSGGAIYGNPETIPVNEKHRPAPLSYYGAGKIAIETFLRVLAATPEQNVTLIRPPNFYGPGQSYQQGFGIIRTMLEHIHRGTTMEIWGDGETVRDFLYIDDMVSALKLLIDMPTDNDTYNIASGKGHSLNQVKDIIETVCNKKLNVKYRRKRKSDVNCIVLDSSRFAKNSGWQPKITLEKGIVLTWRWVQGQ